MGDTYYYLYEITTAGGFVSWKVAESLEDIPESVTEIIQCKVDRILRRKSEWVYE